MTSRQVIHFEFQQSLSWDSDSPRWSERLQASVHLTDAALSSGWLRQHFSGRRGGANDFLVLVAIVMHARPLGGVDLDYLVGLKMATRQDEGRLYARVTDLGLSEELGMHRTTIAASAERLKRSGFIDITEVPDEVDYRDSKGRFAGSKVYLLSGELQKQFLSKALQPIHADRVGLTDPDQPTTVSVKPTHRDSPTDINLRGGGGGDSFSAFGEEKIWQFFAVCKGEPDYAPKPREKRLLQRLFADGYAQQEIQEGIRSAFQDKKPGDPVRHFGFCVPVIRAKPPKTSPALAPDPALAVDSGSTPGENQPGTPTIPEHVSRIFTQANHDQPPTRTDLRRLSWLHEECTPIAQQAGQDAWEWIVEALKAATGQAHNLLPYITALVRKKKNQVAQQSANNEGMLAMESKADKATHKPPTPTQSPVNSQLTALARRGKAASTGGFVIPAEYSRNSLLQALEQIPDDH